MNARFVDLPLEKLAHRLNHPGIWEALRGTPVKIDPFPFPNEYTVRLPNDCDAPAFLLLPRRKILPEGVSHLVCLHVIELDESALDIEVEALAKDCGLEYAGVETACADA
jgi:hypothetical protein